MRHPTRGFTMVAMCITACSSRPLEFKNHPDFVWWTDHETGDFSDWQGGVAPGGFTFSDASKFEVVSGFAHSGSHALRLRAVGPTMGGWTTAVVARNGPLPSEGYYSAWYYLPSAIEPQRYWIYFLFRSRRTPLDTTSPQNEYNLSFRMGVGGSLESVLVGSDNVKVSPTGDITVPTSKWFQIEAYLRVASDATGHITVWQDDSMIYDVSGPTAVTPYVEWLLGGVVEGLSVEPGELYIDDAAITTRRIGSQGLPFVRE